LREKWIKCINPKDFQPTKYSYVCVKRFEPHLVIYEDKKQKPNGELLITKRSYPTLVSGAYPTSFLNQSPYLSKTLPLKRKTPEERRSEIEERCNLQFEAWCAADNITSFEDFVSQLPQKGIGDWIYVVQDESVLFLKLSNGCVCRLLCHVELKII